MKTISIVLPTYNGEKYLRQSIESILTQTHTNWELILVDDASIDNTAKIVDEYASLDDRIHVIHNKENQKLPQSLNIGFSIASGEYLTWTSDDNMYMPNALEVMAEYLDSHEDAYMVCAEMLMIDEEENIIRQFDAYNGKKMYAYDCVGACFMYRKEVRETIGNYDVNTFCVEDYDYWLRVLDHYGKILPINQVLYQYRVHEGSLTARKRQQVKDQLAKLRVRYVDKMFKSLSEDIGELYRIYFEMRNSKYMTHAVRERFMNVFPALRGVVPFTRNKVYIIFGAGKYGEKAATALEDCAVFFADSTPEKVGEVKCGLRILSFRDAVGMAGIYHFLIAAAGLKGYEMMKQLWDAGIKEYSLFEIQDND